VGRSGFGGVGEQALAGVGGQGKDSKARSRSPTTGMVEELDAAGVDSDVVRGPALSELFAAGGQLPDQVREVPVVGVAAGFGAQQGDGVVGGLVVVAEELSRVRVEEDEPGGVGRSSGVAVDR
jgi:hypothetical protein